MTFAIRIRGLFYTYPDGKAALRGVNLDIASRSRLGLVGPNGAGKSTLLQHINGLLRGDGGVELFGETITAHNLATARRRVGLVFQDPDDMLFMPRLYDDVAFGVRNAGSAPDEVDRAVAAALAAVGLTGFEYRSPHRLSAGEKKRAALACILALEPDVLLLDEPTANLDGRQRRALADLLAPWPRTMVVASHDLDFVKRLCDGAAVMNDGRIVARGGVGDLARGENLRTWGLA